MSIPFPNTSADIKYPFSISSITCAVGILSSTTSKEFPKYLNFNFLNFSLS
ncbi:hypothetical protein [uncultured Fusobacterium sp.]|uniref:hypothetical protein n=1 Tax=uncultured Fusobacterium sp. TaxID=159267 RepID=UPI0025FD8B44|nr:hypothetical protein [uncultured Fusobacterium sp.]